MIRIRKAPNKLLYLFRRKEHNNEHKIQFHLCINHAIINIWYHRKNKRNENVSLLIFQLINSVYFLPRDAVISRVAESDG